MRCVVCRTRCDMIWSSFVRMKLEGAVEYRAECAQWSVGSSATHKCGLIESFAWLDRVGGALPRNVRNVWY